MNLKTPKNPLIQLFLSFFLLSLSISLVSRATYTSCLFRSLGSGSTNRDGIQSTIRNHSKVYEICPMESYKKRVYSNKSSSKFIRSDELRMASSAVQSSIVFRHELRSDPTSWVFITHMFSFQMLHLFFRKIRSRNDTRIFGTFI